MPANVETMFYVRTVPWHGLGVCVEEALDSKEALEKSGLNWNVIQRPILGSVFKISEATESMLKYHNEQTSIIR